MANTQDKSVPITTPPAAAAAAVADVNMTDKTDVDVAEELVNVKLLTAAMLRENPEIKLSQDPDIITLEADKSDPRAAMPCGHAITPASLTQYMRSLVTVKLDNIIRCCALKDATRENAAAARVQGSGDGDTICHAIWEYPLCRKIAMLTQEERTFFEKGLSANFATGILHYKSCPHCHTHYYRDARDPATPKNVRTSCLVCHQDFCYRCGLGWKAKNSQMVCGNDSCVASLTKVVDILTTCPKKTVAGMKIPTVRACPYPECLARFPQLIEHVALCKYMTCPSCRGSYCHACLSRFTGRDYPATCNGVDSTCEKVAKRQTMEDIKKGQA